MHSKADLHVHTKVSKVIPFRMSYFLRAVSRARYLGHQGFALTEHFHSIDYWQTMNWLALRFPYIEGRLSIFSDFNVLTGAELTLADHADVTLIGPLESLAWLDKQFSPSLSEGQFPYLKDVIEPAHTAGLIIIGAHPTRPVKRLTDIDPEILAKLDALEVSGKDMASHPANEIVGQLASELNLPVVGGSDAHLWAQVGVQYTVIPHNELTFKNLKHSLLENTTRTVTSANVRKIVRSCEVKKRRFKAKMRERQKRSQQQIAKQSAVELQLGLVPANAAAPHSTEKETATARTRN